MLAFVIAIVFGFYELKSRLYTNELLARNESERTLNLLLSVARSLRDKDGRFDLPFSNPPKYGPDPIKEANEFIAAIQSESFLRQRVLGIAAYGVDGKLLYRYGSAPKNKPDIEELDWRTRNPPRAYRFDARTRSVRIIHPFPVFRTNSDLVTPMANKNVYIYYELREETLFQRNALARLVFLIWIVASFAAIVVVRRTVHKNAAYREQLSSQRELVALGSAARTLAHEIKNPLSAISLQADIVGRLCPGVADRELSGIAQETARIRLLVDRIGDFLREPRGAAEDVDLVQFAQNVLAHAGKDGAQVPIVVEDQRVVVSIDPERFRSVLENIVRNAYDSGGDPAEVAVHIRNNGGLAILEVVDRGEGFPSGTDFNRFFDPFFTSKTRGFGLGLALSRRFVEAAEGTITIGNREGGGAIVRVSLPRMKS